ncbi:hypothetical protein V2O64_03645 [Verrucomicrobiaceae bacterium 227]
MSVLQISDLRRQLREKFPAAHRVPVPVKDTPEPQKLEFAQGHLSEIIAPKPSSGMSLLVSELLDQPRDLPIALVDGRDTFDPASYRNEQCRRLIWLRCHKTQQALQCVDLLLRDGNLPLVLLDLHLVCERELRQIPTNLWHRFKTQARDSGASLVAMTPRPLIPSPHRRLTLSGHFSLDHLELQTPTLTFQNTDTQTLVNKA